MRRGTEAAAVSVAVVTLLLAARPAAAQAWTPPAGDGVVTIAVQAIENTGHILSNGSTEPIGRSRTAGVYAAVDLGLTERLSASVGLPLVFARYLGPRPPNGGAELPVVQPVDICYCWQHGVADFDFGVRYNVTNGSLAITPSVAFTLPSHDYEYRGEAVIGRHLREMRIGVDVGSRLERLSPRAAVQLHYRYAVVERVLDIPNNRSNVSVDGTFLWTDRLAVRGTLARQVTHGGLRAGTGPPTLPPDEPWGEIVTLEQFREHDRLLRDNHWRLGAGVSYDLDRLELFASYLAFVAGTDTHAGRAVTFGASIPFHISLR